MQDTQHLDGDDPLRVYALPQQHVINTPKIDQSELWSSLNVSTNESTSRLGDYSPRKEYDAAITMQLHRHQQQAHLLDGILQTITCSTNVLNLTSKTLD